MELNLDIYSAFDIPEDLDIEKIDGYFPSELFKQIRSMEIESYTGKFFKKHLDIKKTISQVGKDEDDLNIILTDKKLWLGKERFKGSTAIINTNTPKDINKRCVRSIGYLLGLYEHSHRICLPKRVLIIYSKEQEQKTKEAYENKDFDNIYKIMKKTKGSCLMDSPEADGFCETHKKQLELLLEDKKLIPAHVLITTYFVTHAPLPLHIIEFVESRTK